ncbi:n-acetylglutamate synthase [Echinicola sediminis]
MNYNNRRFQAISNSGNGEVSTATVFLYQQDGEIVSGSYSGGEIVTGHLIGKVDAKGCIDMRYHHINAKGELMTGKCFSIPEVMESGKIRLLEKWEWTSGDCSKGESVIEEI